MASCYKLHSSPATEVQISVCYCPRFVLFCFYSGYVSCGEKNLLNQFEMIHSSLSILCTKFSLSFSLSLSLSLRLLLLSAMTSYQFPTHHQWCNASLLLFSTRRSLARSHARLRHTHTHVTTHGFLFPPSSHFTHTTYSTAQCSYNLLSNTCANNYNKASRASHLEKRKRHTLLRVPTKTKQSREERHHPPQV